MAKYDLAYKLAVVKAYLNGEDGYRTVATEFGIADHSTVRKWVKNYETLGESGLEQRISHKTYSVQFKLDVIQYKLETDELYLDIVIKFGLNEPSVITNWLRTWQQEGTDGLSKLKGRPTMSNKPKNQNKKNKKLTREQELERENELLRVENAYLKKLRASGRNIPSRLRKQSPESSKNSEKSSD